MIVDEEEGKVFVRVLRDRLATDHCVAVICVHLLCYHVHELSLPLLYFALVDEEHLGCLLFWHFLFPRLSLHLGFVVAEHLFEHAQVSLMLESHSRKQRIIIRGELIKLIVAHQDHLNLFHVIFLVHLESAAVHYLLQCGLPISRIILILAQEVVDLIGKLMAFFEALMVGADQDYSEVCLLEADIHV